MALTVTALTQEVALQPFKSLSPLVGAALATILRQCSDGVAQGVEATVGGLIKLVFDSSKLTYLVKGKRTARRMLPSVVVVLFCVHPSDNELALTLGIGRTHGVRF